MDSARDRGAARALRIWNGAESGWRSARSCSVMRAREGGRYKINYKEPAGRRRYEQQTLGHDAKGGGPPRGRRPFAWLVFTDRLSLLCVNHAEESGEII